MKPKTRQEAVSAVIGVILMVAITVTLAAVLFVVTSNYGREQEAAPQMAFREDASDDEVQVIAAPIGMDWSELNVQGCTGVPSGTVQAGQILTGCSGTVSIAHLDSNSLIYQREV